MYATERKKIISGFPALVEVKSGSGRVRLGEASHGGKQGHAIEGSHVTPEEH